MPQPAFWLSVTPVYAIENFEQLLKYVRSYQYLGPEERESDFNRTADVLTEVAKSLIDISDECHLEQEPDFGMPVMKVMRIIAAAFATEFKRGCLDHSLLLGLIRIILLSSTAPAKYSEGFIKAISACARKADIEGYCFNYLELYEANFSIDILCNRIASIKWIDTPYRAYFEGAGTVLFKNNGAELVAKNHHDILITEDSRRPVLYPGVGFTVTTKGGRLNPTPDFEFLLKLARELIQSLRGVTPSPVTQLKKYQDEDNLDVKVINKIGFKIVCESIDPSYQPVKGNLMLNLSNSIGIDNTQFLDAIHEGDILTAIYQPMGNCIFRFDNGIERAFKSSFEGERVSCIFDSAFSTGTRWLSEVGMLINVSNRALNNYIYTDFLESDPDPERLVELRIIECKEDGSGNPILIGDFLPETEQKEEEYVNEDEFRSLARRNLAKRLLIWIKETSENDPDNEDDTPKDISVGSKPVETLGMLMMRSAERRREMTTTDRLQYLVVATLLFECCLSEINRDIARREISYKKALAAFAMGDSPATLSFSPTQNVIDLCRTTAEKSIIDILRSYREAGHMLQASDHLIGEQFDVTEQLIKASNTLIDKIDAGEITRIKKTIATKLGVGDMFRNPNSQLTFYGFENEMLEFKVSCARPPYNRAVASATENARIQAFTILKTVCAFLNSPNGGELLIGVNDEGYAVGITQDIDLLYASKLILEPNPDRVRIYLKNKIDQGFISYDGSAKGTAITSGTVSINIEKNEKEKVILRVKVNPYPYDVVKIAPEFVLSQMPNTYYRSSGASVPLQTDGVRNIRVEKLKQLAPNEYEASVILQAIDSKKQVAIRGYRTRKGLQDYIVEPTEINIAEGIFQAFDTKKLQMGLFHISHSKSMELLSTDFSFTRRHSKLKVDVFGFPKTQGASTTIVSMKVSDYALMLLHEAHPTHALLPEELYVEKPNTDPDSHKFPTIITLSSYDPIGPAKFAAGMDNDILIL